MPPRSHHLSEVSSRAYPDLERVPGKQNWVEKTGGLPSYIERIAKHLHYEKGRTIGAAIATAVETTRRWCSTGKNWNGGDVSAATQAKACKAVASWESKKAKSKAKTAAKSMKEAIADAQAIEPTPAIEILEMYDGKDLGEAVLSYKDKKKLPTSAFAVPGERKYPIHDEAHARNALARVSQYGTSQEKNMVREAVTKRYPNIEISEAEQFALSQDEVKEIALLAQQRLLAVEGMLPLLREKQTRGKKQIVESASELLEAELTAPFSLTMVGGESAEPKAQKEMAEALAQEAEELRALCESLGLELGEAMDPVDDAESRVEKAKKRSPRDRKKKGGQDKPPWEEDNPKPKKQRKELTPEQKAKAKARAKKAGRKYPNLVDNMAASEMAEGYGYGKMAGMSSMPAPKGDMAEMKRGDEGPEVEMAQKQVMALGSYVGDAGADGKFGTQTEDGVKRVQRKFGLKADGVVGPKTNRVLKAAKVDESVPPMGMNADIVKDRSSDEVLEAATDLEERYSGPMGALPMNKQAQMGAARSAKPKTRDGKEMGGPSNAEFERLHPRGRGGLWITKGIQNELGIKNATGKMDANTTEKIKEFQRQNGLQVDGIVGSQTAAAMMDSSASVGALTAEQRDFLAGRGQGPKGRPLNKRVMEAAEELVPEEVVSDEVSADEEAESEGPSEIEEPVSVVTEDTEAAGNEIKVNLDSANAIEVSEGWSLSKNRLREAVDFDTLSTNPSADGADMANATDGNPSSGRKEPPNLRESNAGTGTSNCGNCDYFEDGKCVEYGVGVREGQICDHWSGKTEIAEATIDNRVRGAIRSGLTGWTRDRIAKIRRLPDGTFAPLGRGRVLRPGQAVSLGGKRGKVTDGGQSVELANGQKVKLAMPAVQQMPMRDARKVAASGSDEDLSAQERATLSPEQQMELRKARRGMDSPTAELAKKRDERARERRLRVPTTNTKPAPMPKRTFPMSDEEMRKRGAMDSPDLDTTLGSEVTIDGKKYKKSLLGDFGPAAPASAWVPEAGGESLTDEGVRDLLRKSERQFTISATDSIVDAMDSPSGGWTNDATWQMAQELDNNERAYNQVQNILDKNDTIDAIASELRDTFGKPDDDVNWDELADTWAVDFDEMASPGAAKRISPTQENIQKEASYWRGKGLPQDEAAFLAENSIRAHNQRVEREAALRAEMEYAQMRPFQSAGAAVPRMASPGEVITLTGKNDPPSGRNPLERVTHSETIPAGTYVIGDPAYFKPSEWQSGNAWLPIISFKPERLNVDSKNAWVSTAYGDGGYTDESGFTYGVDTGVISIIGDPNRGLEGMTPNPWQWDEAKNAPHPDDPSGYGAMWLEAPEEGTPWGPEGKPYKKWTPEPWNPDLSQGMRKVTFDGPVSTSYEAGDIVFSDGKTTVRIPTLGDAAVPRMSSPDAPDLKDQSISELADLIRKDWGSNVNFAAKPYLDAMGALNSIDDMYGLDSGRMVVAYFLSNARGWKGDTARAVKAELKRRSSKSVADRNYSMDDYRLGGSRSMPSPTATVEEVMRETGLLDEVESYNDFVENLIGQGIAPNDAYRIADLDFAEGDTLAGIRPERVEGMASPGIDLSKYGKGTMSRDEFNALSEDELRSLWMDVRERESAGGVSPNEASALSQMDGYVVRDRILKMVQKAEDAKPEEQRGANSLLWMWSPGETSPETKSLVDTLDKGMKFGEALDRAVAKVRATDFGSQDADTLRAIADRLAATQSVDAQKLGQDMRAAAEIADSQQRLMNTMLRRGRVDSAGNQYVGMNSPDRFSGMPAESSPAAEAWAEEKVQRDFIEKFMDDNNASEDAAATAFDDWYQSQGWSDAMADAKSEWGSMDSPGKRPKVSDVEEWDTVDGGWERSGIKVEEARKIKDGTYGGVTAESWVNSGGVQRVSGPNIKTKYFYGETAWSDAQRYAQDAAWSEDNQIMEMGSPVPHYGNGIRRPMGNLRNLHALSDDKLNILRARVLQSGDRQGAKALRAEMGLRGMASPELARPYLDIAPSEDKERADFLVAVRDYGPQYVFEQGYDAAFIQRMEDEDFIEVGSVNPMSNTLAGQRDGATLTAKGEETVAGMTSRVGGDGVEVANWSEVSGMDSPGKADPFFGFGEEVIVSSPNSPRDGQRGKVVSNRMSMDGKAPLFHYLVEFDDGQEQVVESHLVTPAEEKADEDSATGRAMLTIVEMMSPDRMVAPGNGMTPFLVRETEITPDEVGNWVRRGRMNDPLDDSSLQRAFDEELAAYALGAYGGLDHQGLASAKFTGLRARRWKLNSAMASPGLPDNYTQPEVDSGELVGTDGNAFAVMGFVTNALRDAGNDQSVVDAYVANATSGDYNHLLQVSMAYLDGDSDAMASPDVSGQLNAIYGMDQNETLDFPDGIQVERLVDTDELYDAGPTYIVRQGENSALLYGPNKVINNVEERLGLVMASPWTSSGLKVSMADLENFNLGDEYNDALDEYRRLNRELKKAMDADNESLADDIRYELNDAEEKMLDLRRRVTAKEEIDSGEEVLVDENGKEIMLSPSPAVLGGIKGKRHADRAVFNSPMPNPSPQPSVDEIVQSVLRSEAVGPFRNTVTLPNGTVLQYFYGQGASEGIFTPDEVIRPSAVIEIGDKVQYFYNLSLTRAAEVARDLDAMLDGSGPLDITEVHTAFETLANAESVREREVAAANTLATALGIHPTAINKSVRDANAWQNTAMVLPNTTVPKGTMASPGADTTDMDIPEGFQVNTSALEMGEMPNGTLFTMKDGFRYVKHRNTDADEPDKVWVIAKPVDSNGNVIQVDPAFEALEGQPPKAAHGPTRRILHRRFAPALVGGMSPDYSEEYGFGDPQEPGDAVSIAKKFPGQVADAVLDEVAMASPSPAPDGFENKRASSIEVGDTIIVPELTGTGGGYGYGSTKIKDSLDFSNTDDLVERGWSSGDIAASYQIASAIHGKPLLITNIEEAEGGSGLVAKKGYIITLDLGSTIEGADYVGGSLTLTTSTGKIIARSLGGDTEASEATDGLDSDSPIQTGSVRDLPNVGVTAMLDGKQVTIRPAGLNTALIGSYSGWDEDEDGPFTALDAVYEWTREDEDGNETIEVIKATPDNIDAIQDYVDFQNSDKVGSPIGYDEWDHENKGSYARVRNPYASTLFDQRAVIIDGIPALISSDTELKWQIPSQNFYRLDASELKVGNVILGNDGTEFVVVSAQTTGVASANYPAPVKNALGVAVELRSKDGSIAGNVAFKQDAQISIAKKSGVLEKADIPVVGKSPAQVSGSDLTPDEDSLYDLTKKAVLGQPVPLGDQIDNYETDQEYNYGSSKYRYKYPAGVQTALLDIPEGETTTIAGVKVRRESADKWAVWRSSFSNTAWTSPFDMDDTITAMRNQREDDPSIKDADTEAAPASTQGDMKFSEELASLIDNFQHSGPGGDKALPAPVRDALLAIPEGVTTTIAGVKVRRQEGGDFAVQSGADGWDENLATPWVAVQSIKDERDDNSGPDLPEGASITKTANGFVWKAPNGQVGQAGTEDEALASINSNLETPDEPSPASSVAGAAEQLGMSEDEVNAKIAELEGQGITLDPESDSAETIASVVQAASGTMASPGMPGENASEMSRTQLLGYLGLTESDLPTEELRRRVSERMANTQPEGMM